MKRLRACLDCKLIKTEGQFKDDSCDNCKMRFDGIEDVQRHTTSNFSGLISMMETAHSWVAKWQDLTNMCEGVYAIDVKPDFE
jgi:transcription elongation factor SPT4